MTKTLFVWIVLVSSTAIAAPARDGRLSTKNKRAADAVNKNEAEATPSASEEQAFARVVSITGVVQMRAAGQSHLLTRFERIPEGATIITGPNSMASLRLFSGSLVRLGPETEIALTQLEMGEVAARRKERLNLVVGRLWARVMSLLGSESRFEVQTETAVAGVRGTAFWASVENGASHFVLEHGALMVQRDTREVLLTGNGAAIVSDATGMKAPVVLNAREMRTIQEKTSGVATDIQERARTSDEATSRQDQRTQTRQDIVRPDVIVDSPIRNTTPSDQVHKLPAQIDIRLNLPDPVRGQNP